MKILLLAPHPFYQNRGTPIAVDLLAKTLCEAGHTVHMLTFSEGEDRQYDNFRIFRVGRNLRLKGIRPGFSIKKLALDALMIPHVAVRLSRDRYDVVHAVEESAFIAWFFSLFTGKPFIYDMDSSLATQITDKYSLLKPISGLLRWLESIPIKRSLIVVPVCDALTELSYRYRDSGVHQLNDISMLESTPVDQLPEDIGNQRVDFKTLFPTRKRILLYVGNLESYQGIDLMIDSFARAVLVHEDLALVIVGGNESDVSKYSELTERSGLGNSIRFLGPKPIALLKSLCDQSHLLLSPRVHGENTPMKLYSYMDAGVPVLATDLPTHTDVINKNLGFLAAPEADAFASAIVNVFNDYENAEKKASKARIFISENHSLPEFKKGVHIIYGDVQNSMALKRLG